MRWGSPSPQSGCWDYSTWAQVLCLPAHEVTVRVKIVPLCLGWHCAANKIQINKAKDDLTFQKDSFLFLDWLGCKAFLTCLLWKLYSLGQQFFRGARRGKTERAGLLTAVGILESETAARKMGSGA